MRRYKFLIIIGIIIIMVAAFAGIIQQQTPLQGYVETSSPSSSSSSTTEEMTSFTDSVTGFTMNVPASWTKVTMDGCPTFIHRASASSVQIQVQDYYPQINSVTTESVSASLSQDEFTLLDFYWVDSSSYVSTYTGSSASGTISDYIELVYFDRSHIITVLYTIPDEYYSRLSDTISTSIDSISWTPADPIPDGYRLYYNEFGNFEFATPLDWVSAIQNGAYYAQDSVTGAVLTVAVYESNTNYSNVTQMDYAAYASQGRSNFLLSSFSADDNLLYADGSYTANGQQMYFIQYRIANGSYEYSISFECPASTYQSAVDAINTSVEYFRYFS